MSEPRASAQRDGNGSFDRGATTLELPLAELPSGHPCQGCGECCHYVAVEIDNPSAFTDYDHIFWYLTHKGVSVYVDFEGVWYIEFETVCDHLTDTHTCGIYDDRPKICSDFSWFECEKTSGESAAKHRFVTADEFFAWVSTQRPRAWAKYCAARKRLLAKRRAARPTARRRRGEAAARALATRP